MSASRSFPDTFFFMSSALILMLASGFLISWAMAAAICPRITRRLFRPSAWERSSIWLRSLKNATIALLFPRFFISDRVIPIVFFSNAPFATSISILEGRYSLSNDDRRTLKKGSLVETLVFPSWRFKMRLPISFR